jgi:hypothetical protein
VDRVDRLATYRRGCERLKGEVRCDRKRPANGPSSDTTALSDRKLGNTDGNGLLEPYDVKMSSTVLRGGRGRNASPLPDLSNLGGDAVMD